MDLLWLLLTATFLLRRAPAPGGCVGGAPRPCAVPPHGRGTSSLCLPPDALQPPSKAHRRGNQAATKGYPTATPEEDNEGRWATIDDHDDRAEDHRRGARADSRCKPPPEAAHVP